MVLAPVFGYMGDRYKRKYIMAVGILVWSGTVFVSTLLDKDVSTTLGGVEGEGYSLTVALRVCTTQQDYVFGTPDLEGGI